MRVPIHSFMIALLGVILAAPALAAPVCKRLSGAQLMTALATADKSIEALAGAALAPAIAAQNASNWRAGDASLDVFFARSSEIALKSKDAQFVIRDVLDRGQSPLDSVLGDSNQVKPGSETSRMSAPQLLLANRKRVTAMLREVPRASEGQSEEFQAAVLDLKNSGLQFLNVTTPLLAHYNCDAMAKSAGESYPEGGVCLESPIPLAPLYGVSVAPVRNSCQGSASVSNLQGQSKSLHYSTPNGQVRPVEGGSSSSGGAK